MLLWVAMTVVLVAAVGWSWLRWGPTPATPGPRQTSVAACPAQPSFAPRPATLAADAPDGGAVRVLESGFTQLDGSPVTIGVVLHNTSRLVAYRTRISLRVYDDQRRSAVHPASGRLLEQEIPVILPDQRIGVGAWTDVADGPRFTKVVVAEVVVEPGTTQWWPADVAGPTFAAVTASYQQTQRSQPDSPEDGRILFATTSAYCHPLHSRQVAAVYRNAAGKIVGGVLNASSAGVRACGPGQIEESVFSYGTLPPDIDDSKTEIYPYCDLMPADRLAPPPVPAN